MDVQAKVALVTGAARGIGSSIASRLAEDGCRVVLVDRLDSVHESSKSLSGRGLTVASLTCEMGNVDGIKQIFDFASNTFGKVDILVNNAGFDARGPDGSTLKTTETSLATWKDVIQVNLTAPFMLCQQCLPGMRSRGWGRIVNMASRAGRPGAVPSGTSTAYTASKSGLIGFSRILAREVGDAAITVNCVAPGIIATPGSNVVIGAHQDSLASKIPLNRLGQAGDVASVVSFLVSERASYITGASFDVNGGGYMN